MSDYHEIFENWGEIHREYDPDYPMGTGHSDDEHVKPVDPDAWADKDIEGGF